jgi:hypothetical protein
LNLSIAYYGQFQQFAKSPCETCCFYWNTIEFLQPKTTISSYKKTFHEPSRIIIHDWLLFHIHGKFHFHCIILDSLVHYFRVNDHFTAVFYKSKLQAKVRGISELQNVMCIYTIYCGYNSTSCVIAHDIFYMTIVTTTASISTFWVEELMIWLKQRILIRRRILQPLSFQLKINNQLDKLNLVINE